MIILAENCYQTTSIVTGCYSQPRYNGSFLRRAPAELLAKNQGEMPTFNFAAMNVGATTLTSLFYFV